MVFDCESNVGRGNREGFEEDATWEQEGPEDEEVKDVVVFGIDDDEEEDEVDVGIDSADWDFAMIRLEETNEGEEAKLTELEFDLLEIFGDFFGSGEWEEFDECSFSESKIERFTLREGVDLTANEVREWIEEAEVMYG